jgi:hypothetical protein
MKYKSLFLISTFHHFSVSACPLSSKGRLRDSTRLAEVSTEMARRATRCKYFISNVTSVYLVLSAPDLRCDSADQYLTLFQRSQTFMFFEKLLSRCRDAVLCNLIRGLPLLETKSCSTTLLAKCDEFISRLLSTDFSKAVS